MNDRSQDYLEDILASIEKIEAYVQDIDLTGFQASSLIQDAVIRNLEIIGEATRRFPAEFLQAHPELPVQKAISMRNLLIHQYDGIDLELLWETIEDDLQPLKTQVAEILRSMESK